MDANKYRKVVHCMIWFGDKFILSKVIKESYHKGFWGDAGGKVEKDEDLLFATRREIFEETGLKLSKYQFKLIDCFIYDEREIKTFVFEVRLPKQAIVHLEDKEPTKLSPWKLFTKDQALRLKLLPAVRQYLKNLK